MACRISQTLSRIAMDTILGVVGHRNCACAAKGNVTASGHYEVGETPEGVHGVTAVIGKAALEGRCRGIVLRKNTVQGYVLQCSSTYVANDAGPLRMQDSICNGGATQLYE
jgi:hypothetical protein